MYSSFLNASFDKAMLLLTRTHTYQGPSSFHLEFSSLWVSRSVDLGDLRRGSGNFFKNCIFEISTFQGKKNEACLGFKVKIFNKSVHRGGVAVCASFFAKSFDILIAHK